MTAMVRRPCAGTNKNGKTAPVGSPCRHSSVAGSDYCVSHGGMEDTKTPELMTKKPDRPAVHCTAKNREGLPCRSWAIKGGTVCMRHGGNLPSVREAANNRLQEMVNPALDKLEEILEAPGTTDSDKLKAITMVLNRTGYGEKNSLAIEHTAKPWEGLVDSILVDTEVDEDGQVIEAEVIDED